MRVGVVPNAKHAARDTSVTLSVFLTTSWELWNTPEIPN